MFLTFIQANIWNWNGSETDAYDIIKVNWRVEFFFSLFIYIQYNSIYNVNQFVILRVNLPYKVVSYNLNLFAQILHGSCFATKIVTLMIPQYSYMGVVLLQK